MTQHCSLLIQACSVQDGGFQLAFDPVKVKLQPTAKDVQVAEESILDPARKN